MQIVGVDERDSTWERTDAVYRVYLFSGVSDENAVHPSWVTDTYDISDADVSSVIEWAASQLEPNDVYAIALREGEGSKRGLVWLVGCDMNGEPLNEAEEMLQARKRESRKRNR